MMLYGVVPFFRRGLYRMDVRGGRGRARWRQSVEACQNSKFEIDGREKEVHGIK